MRTIGLIGGMSWENSIVYYQQINRAVRESLGGLHSAQLVLHSCDFAAIAALQKQDAWDALADQLAQAAQALERAGADCVAICTNTMHKVAGEVQAAINVPLIDIRDVTGSALNAQGVRKICLLGTRYTMEQTFFRTPLQEKWGLEVVIPDEAARETVHAIIFEELCQGVVCPTSRQTMRAIIAEQSAHGVEAVILGCTELMLLLDQEHSTLPLVDTTTLHARALADFALLNAPS